MLLLCMFMLHQDFKLLFFIKKRKAQAGIHPDPAILIPWKVSTKQDERKITIPTKACIISSTFLILIVIGLILSFRMFRQYQHENQAFFLIWLFFMSMLREKKKRRKLSLQAHYNFIMILLIMKIQVIWKPTRCSR